MLPLLLLTQRARATQAPGQVELPPGCGSAEEFRVEVDHRLGPGFRLPLRLLRIAPEGTGGFRLDLQVGEESRQLRDADCRELFRAAVVVAVTTTLSTTSDAPVPSTADASIRSASATAAPPQPVPSVPAGSPSNEGPQGVPANTQAIPSVAVTLGAGIQAGLQPEPAVSLELEGRALWRRFGVAIAGRDLLSNSMRRGDGRGVALHGLGAHLTGLYRLSPRWEMRLGAAGYRLSGSGLGTAADRTAGAWALGPSAGVAVALLPAGPVLMMVGGDAHWNVIRPSFEILNYGEVFSSSLVDFSIFFRVGPRLH